VVPAGGKVALAKQTVGGDEVNQHSYGSERDRRKWEPSCLLLYCDVDGMEKPPYCDLNQSIMMNTFGTKFSGSDHSFRDT
jgi:hypothetical protein